MALNVPIFKTRSLTAAVFVIVMLAGLLWNPWCSLVLFTVIHTGCWIEYQRLTGMIDKDYAGISWLHRYAVIIAGFCLMLFAFDVGAGVAGVSLDVIGSWGFAGALCVMVIGSLKGNLRVQSKNVGRSILGLVYISIPLALLTALRTLFYQSLFPADDRMPVVMIIGSIWINDTMAYVMGSLIGKTPLSAISPKKTWEGTVGGIVLAVAVMGLLGYLLRNNAGWGFFPPSTWMIVAAISAVAGTFGDLLESKLKRMAGVKDSGHIMPGHGGFLDRFDSLLVATPCVCAWGYLMMLIG
jgi:phosphatidate cytidylyltransferase